MSFPWFSIVVPAYNRPTQVARAIRSVPDEPGIGVEILVVDDASTDDTSEAVRGLGDPRVRLLRHDRNRGPCPARNTAVAAARGTWCVMLDSDFSLLPGALPRLLEATSSAPPKVGNVVARCRWDTGASSPVPPLAAGIVDEAAYLAWLDTATVPEYFNCVRRTVFEDLAYPDSRAWESEFHFGLAARWRLLALDDEMVLIHTDAPNRLTTSAGAAARARLRRDAPDQQASLDRIWGRHGLALSRHAPGEAHRVLRRRALQAFLTGARFRGTGAALAALRRRPFDLGTWAIVAAGMAGPGVLAGLVTARRQRVDAVG